MIRLSIFFIFITTLAYSQTITYRYNYTAEYIFDGKSNAYNLVEKSDEKSNSLLIISEKEKMILISRKFTPSIGESVETLESFYYVKQKMVGNEQWYYAVDLENKKYIEFHVTKDMTKIVENCNAFENCKNITTLSF